MRLIVIGCEYAGKSTLIDGLAALGKDLGMRVHLDDHFSIPDEFFLKPDDQAAMPLPPELWAELTPLLPPSGEQISKLVTA